MRPRRAPARVLHKNSAAFMLGALAQDMLTPLRPAPNWLTQRAPPFVPYDPWQEHRRHARIVDARQRAQMRREIRPSRAPRRPRLPTPGTVHTVSLFKKLKLRFKNLAQLVAFRNWRLRLRPCFEHAESSDLGERLSRHRYFTGPSVRCPAWRLAARRSAGP